MIAARVDSLRGVTARRKVCMLLAAGAANLPSRAAARPLHAAASAGAMPRFQGVEVVDSHLHVWSPTYPYAPGKEPPADLGCEVASVEAFRAVMAQWGISKAIVVQPINYEFDHSYLEQEVAANHGDSMRLMLLLDPSRGVAQLDALPHGRGPYAGVRFNPYLQDGWMTSDAGLAAFQRCGELGLPVGVMCFQGLDKHENDLREMLAASPASPPLIIDHWGFFRDNAAAAPSAMLAPNEASWQALLKLGRDHPGRVFVKLSALFRVSSAELPYPDLVPRLKELVDVFSSQRLMYGSDFPFVQQEANGGYGPNLQAFHDLLTAAELSDDDISAIMGGTAASLFFT